MIAIYPGLSNSLNEGYEIEESGGKGLSRETIANEVHDVPNCYDAPTRRSQAPTGCSQLLRTAMLYHTDNGEVQENFLLTVLLRYLPSLTVLRCGMSIYFLSMLRQKLRQKPEGR